MDIVVTGTIVQMLQGQSGVSQKTGNQWARQPYIIEHEHGQYPRRMVFDVSNAKIQELNLQVGETVTLHLNIDCREYPQGSGKFFNSIEAWKADRMGQQQGMQGGWPQQQGWQQPPQQFQQQGWQQSTQQFPLQQQLPPQQAASAPFPPQVNAQGQPMQQQVAQPAQQQGSGLPFPPPAQ